jgi:GTP-binding protein HflX
MPQVALVGYTNVGKSTLLNALVKDGPGVYADDKLFATLDPTTRRVKLPAGRVVLFTDTVGFIQKLPHELVAAFRATLEEVAESTLLVHVVDAAAEDRDDQERTVVEVIRTLGGEKIPMITAYNKIDQVSAAERRRLGRKDAHLISGKTGDGLRELLIAIEEKLDEHLMEVSLTLPFNKQRLLGELYRTAHILFERTTASGTEMRVRIDPANWQRISKQLESEAAA